MSPYSVHPGIELFLGFPLLSSSDLLTFGPWHKVRNIFKLWAFWHYTHTHNWNEIILSSTMWEAPDHRFYSISFYFIKKVLGASLVAQWLRTRLSMQGTRVRSLVREDPTCRRATKPVHHNYWACTLQPASHNYWACVPQLLKPMHPNYWSPRRLEPIYHNKRSPHLLQLEKARVLQRRPNAAKKKSAGWGLLKWPCSWKTTTDSIVGWIVSPKFVCWSPNPQCLRMWPYLETGSL